MSAPYCSSCGYRHPAGRPEFMVCGEKGVTMYTLLHCPACERPKHHGPCSDVITDLSLWTDEPPPAA